MAALAAGDWRSLVNVRVNRTIELISVTFILGQSPVARLADRRVSGEGEERDFITI